MQCGVFILSVLGNQKYNDSHSCRTKESGISIVLPFKLPKQQTSRKHVTGMRNLGDYIIPHNRRTDSTRGIALKKGEKTQRKLVHINKKRKMIEFSRYNS